MNILEILKQAIHQKKSVCFQYVKEGKIRGERVGDPHAIFGHHLTSNVNVHIYETAGVSDSRESLPGWWQFLTENIEDIKLLEDQSSFGIANGYNPNSPMYANVIAKIMMLSVC
jgi:hypothetical protein